VDFGASDSPVESAELARSPGGPVLYVPMVIGAVAVTYHLPALRSPLRLDGDVLADIYRGRITRWNDARLAALNRGLRLPSQEIVVVHRADGSGTTRAFTSYMAAGSTAWRRGPGIGESVRFPTGLGARGNEGVAAQVKQTPGAIGYVELTYATQSRLPVAALRNPAGAFVFPTVQAMSAAADAVLDSLPPDSAYRVSLVNASAPDAYPLASFSWIIVRERPADPARAAQLRAFVLWALREGDDDARELDYAPLPERMRAGVEALAARIGTAGATATAR
jgi:phosphate transport system substrate-binding protein